MSQGGFSTERVDEKPYFDTMGRNQSAAFISQPRQKQMNLGGSKKDYVHYYWNSNKKLSLKDSPPRNTSPDA